MVGETGVKEVNEARECLLKMCLQNQLAGYETVYVSETEIHKKTWIRRMRGEFM